MTGTQNPSRQYFRRNQPYVYKSADNWENWDTDESYDRTFFIGIDDVTDSEHPDVALYMIWGGKAVAVVGTKVLDTISGTVETVTTMAAEIQSVLDEVQRLATAVAQSEQDIEGAILEINALVDRCEGILEGAEAARDLAKEWATKMTGMVEEEGEPVDYSAKYYANEASDSATAAAGSASSASDDATLAEAWATKTDGTVDGSEYSSKYYAGQSADSATTAGTKAGEASASATLASKWATQLTTPVEGGEYSAKQYAQDAGTSAGTAASYASEAHINAGAASGSATAASNSATLAQEWASKMDGQVASTDYSSKYYAGQAANSASYAAGVEANIHNIVDDAAQTLSEILNTPFFFGQSMYSENAPYNASWLASNGQYNASSVYPDFWTQLTGVELNGSLNVGDTIEISGKTYVKRGLPVVLSTGTITDYDFVVDSANSQFRLPLLNGEEDLPGDTYDNLALQASGSTYTASANGWFVFSGNTTGNQGVKLTNTSNGLSTVCQQSTSNQAVVANIKCKKGDVILIGYSVASNLSLKLAYAKGNGTLYYYVGDTVQDASLINAGAVLGQLSNKADIDASNFNASGKSLLSGLGMPSSYYEDLTLLASGSTYTAPANGWFNAITSTSASGINVGLMAINTTTGFYAGEQDDHAGYRVASFQLPVRKGDVMQFYYYGYTAMSYFRFYYAEGEN